MMLFEARETLWLTPEAAAADPERRALLAAAGLAADEEIDEALVIRLQGRPAATAARRGNVLVQFAVAEEQRGRDLTAALVEELRRRLWAEDVPLCRVFTRPAQVPAFQGLGFRLLVSTPDAALLESGPGGLPPFLESLKDMAGARPEPRGCVVLNANPFTLGHRRLVERALAGCAWLFVIVLEDDRSFFPYLIRRRLVEEGCAGLARLTVLGGGDYVISPALFPGYFLKQADERARVQAELDAGLFAARLAPALGVARRFAGEEPLDPLTALYNRVMAETLPPAGIEFREIPRLRVRGEVVSASRVRRALAENRLAEAADLVPPSTLACLRSLAGGGGFK